MEGKVDSRDNVICQDPISEPQSAESNPPINDDELTLVATRDDVADSNRADTIPIITTWYLLTLIYPILSHVFDFVSDIRLIIDYFENQKTVQASLTLVFTILQAIASVWISFLMHNPKIGKDENTSTNRVQKMAKITVHYSIVIILQRALPMCHLCKLYYAWRVHKYQKKEDKVLVNHYGRKMLKEDRDSTVLEVMECFLESAPQLILQLFILLTEDSAISDPMWVKIVSGFATLITLGQTMKDYHCANRLAQSDKAVVGETGGVLLFLWHFGTIAARILLIGIAASTWLSYTMLACVINWMAWTVWIYATENVVFILQRKTADSSIPPQTVAGKIRNLLLASLLAIVYTFTFINLGTGRTFVRNSLYYVVCLWQNGAVFILWFISINPILESVCLSQILVIVSVIFFFIGIGAMATYYMFFHPNLQNRSSDINAENCATCA